MAWCSVLCSISWSTFVLADSVASTRSSESMTRPEIAARPFSSARAAPGKGIVAT